MAITEATQAIWTLDSVLDDGSPRGNDLTAVGGVPKYGQFQVFDLLTSRTKRRKGVIFDKAVSFNAGSGFDFTGSGRYTVVLSFWWHSAAPLGQDKHSVTRQLTPKIAPIVAKATSTTADGVESLTNAEFIVSEIGVSKTQNAIRLALSSTGTSITDVIESNPYLPGLHKIYVAYNETGAADTTGHARIDIDGLKGDITTVGGMTSRVASSVTINNIGYGPTTHKKTSTGSILGDLLALRTFGVTWDALMLKIFRFGWEWGSDRDFNTTSTVFNGFSYHQPSTVTTNQIFTEGGNIFAVRSDGDLVKGFQPVWDTEFDYKNPISLNFLTGSETDENRTITWTPQGLELKGTTIRI